MAIDINFAGHAVGHGNSLAAPVFDRPVGHEPQQTLAGHSDVDIFSSFYWQMTGKREVC